MAIPSWLKQVAAILYDDAGNRIKAGGANGLAVEGPTATGMAVAGNPVQIGGSDGTNLRAISTDTNGLPIVRVRVTDNNGIAVPLYTADLGDTRLRSFFLGVIPYLTRDSLNADQQRTPAVFKTVAAVLVAAGTPVAIWTPTSGKKFRLMGYALSMNVAGSVILKDGSVTELVRTPIVQAGTGTVSPDIGNGILSALANNALYIDVTAGANVTGFVFGTEE